MIKNRYGNNVQKIKSLCKCLNFLSEILKLIYFFISAVGGKDNIRSYWPTFLQDTDVLVFVVDASDIHNISLAIKEVRWLLADDRLANVSVLLIANKQDMPNAIPPNQVADALDLGNVLHSKHKIKVIGTQTPPNITERHSSIVEVEKILLQMINE